MLYLPHWTHQIDLNNPYFPLWVYFTFSEINVNGSVWDQHERVGFMKLTCIYCHLCPLHDLINNPDNLLWKYCAPDKVSSVKSFGKRYLSCPAIQKSGRRMSERNGGLRVNSETMKRRLMAFRVHHVQPSATIQQTTSAALTTTTTADTRTRTLSATQTVAQAN